jgi:hypothetical protein
MFLAGMAMAILAAFSLDHLLKGLTIGEKKIRNRGLVGLVGVSLTIAGGVWFLTGTLALNFAWGVGMLIIAVIGLVLAMGTLRPAPVWVGVFLIGISLLDWVVVDARSLSPRPVDDVFLEKAEVASFLQDQEGQFRVYSPSYSLPQHIAVTYGLELADGVDPMQLADYAAFMTNASGVPGIGYSVTIPSFQGEVETSNAQYLPDARLLGLLNVRYVVAEFPLKVEGLESVEQFGDTWVYENSFARGRAWVGEEKVPITFWSPNRIEIMVEGPGLLVLSEIAYPGWEVRVNGEREEILLVEDILRGVQLGDGDHFVEFEYVPTKFYSGLAIFIISLIAIMVLAFKLRKWI